MRRYLIVAVVVVAIGTGLIPALDLPVRDFYIYWSAAQAVRTGHSPYDMAFLQATQQAAGWNVAHLELIPFQPYLYPPWLALLVWPLSWLPFRSAFAVWVAASGVAVIMALMIEFRAVTWRFQGPALLVLLLLDLTYLPVLHMLAVAQATVWLCLLVALMVWALARKRDTLAAVCLGMLAIKPQIGLFVAAFVGLGWILQHQWRPLLWLTGTWAVCALAGFFVTPSWISEMAAAPQNFQALTGRPALANLADGPTVFAAMRVDIPTSLGLRGVVITAMVVVGVLVVLYILQLVRSHVKPTLLWLSALSCVAVFILTPYARVYDLSLLAWPLIYLNSAPQIKWARWIRYVIVLAVYAWPLVLIAIGADGVWNVPIVLGLATAMLRAESIPVQTVIAASG